MYQGMVLALGAVQSFGAAYLTSHNGCIDARDPTLAAANMSSQQTLVIIPPRYAYRLRRCVRRYVRLRLQGLRA